MLKFNSKTQNKQNKQQQQPNKQNHKTPPQKNPKQTKKPIHNQTLQQNKKCIGTI